MSEVCSGEQTFAQLRTGFRDKLVECCFTVTETIGLIRDGEPRTATSTFTQLLSSVMMMMFVELNVLGRRLTYKLVECCFTATETVGLLGTGAQDGHLDFHTAPELCGDDVVGLNVLGCRLTYIRDKL